uniref:Uncharacterized protein n=1 Tax=Arundo donax TaxID=35708 RepID=A0A0A9HM53_ARUDO
MRRSEYSSPLRKEEEEERILILFPCIKLICTNLLFYLRW